MKKVTFLNYDHLVRHSYKENHEKKKLLTRDEEIMMYDRLIGTINPITPLGRIRELVIKMVKINESDCDKYIKHRDLHLCNCVIKQICEKECIPYCAVRKIKKDYGFIKHHTNNH